MCWNTHSLMKPRRKTAKEDIPVFKALIVDKDYSGRFPKVVRLRSPYKGMKYEQNVKYTTSKVQVESTGLSVAWQVNEGFHSYSRDCTFEWESGPYAYCFPVRTLAVKRRGTLVKEYTGNDICVFEAVIPAGSHYYINNAGEVVSDAIIVKKPHNA